MITFKVITVENYHSEIGQFLRRGNFAVAGLGNGANTIPHDLPNAPRRVWFVQAGNAALGVQVSLDTSQGNADPTGTLGGGKLGYDSTNIYAYTSAAGECIAVVEY